MLRLLFYFGVELPKRIFITHDKHVKEPIPSCVIGRQKLLSDNNRSFLLLKYQ